MINFNADFHKNLNLKNLDRLKAGAYAKGELSYRGKAGKIQGNLKMYVGAGPIGSGLSVDLSMGMERRGKELFEPRGAVGAKEGMTPGIVPEEEREKEQESSEGVRELRQEQEALRAHESSEGVASAGYEEARRRDSATEGALNNIAGNASEKVAAAAQRVASRAKKGGASKRSSSGGMPSVGGEVGTPAPNPQIAPLENGASRIINEFPQKQAATIEEIKAAESEMMSKDTELFGGADAREVQEQSLKQMEDYGRQTAEGIESLAANDTVCESAVASIGSKAVASQDTLKAQLESKVNGSQSEGDLESIELVADTESFAAMEQGASAAIETSAQKMAAMTEIASIRLPETSIARIDMTEGMSEKQESEASLSETGSAEEVAQALSELSEDGKACYDHMPENKALAEQIAGQEDAYKEAKDRLNAEQSGTLSEVGDEINHIYAEADKDVVAEMQSKRTEIVARVSAVKAQQESMMAKAFEEIKAKAESVRSEIESKRQEQNGVIREETRKAKEESEKRKAEATKSQGDGSWMRKAFEGGRKLLRQLKDLASKFMSFLKQRISEGISKFYAMAKERTAEFSAIVSAKMKMISARVMQIATEIADYVASAKQQAIAWLSNKYDALKASVRETRDRWKNKIKAGWNNLMKAVKTAWERVKSFKMPVGEFLLRSACLLVGIPDAGAVIQTLRNLKDGVIALFKSGGGVSKLMSNLWTGAKKGFSAFISGMSIGKVVEGASEYLFSDLKLKIPAKLIDNFSAEALIKFLVKSFGALIFDSVVNLSKSESMTNGSGPGDNGRIMGITITEDMKKDILGNVRKMIAKGSLVDELKDILGNVFKDVLVPQLMSKLLSMLTPAGAIYQLLTTLYRFYLFITKHKDIFESLGTFILSAAGFAMSGDIGAIATVVKALLEKLIPTVCGLVDALFLNGKVKKIVSAPLKKLQKLIQRTTNTVMAKFADSLSRGVKKMPGMKGATGDFVSGKISRMGQEAALANKNDAVIREGIDRQKEKVRQLDKQLQDNNLSPDERRKMVKDRNFAEDYLTQMEEQSAHVEGNAKSYDDRAKNVAEKEAVWLTGYRVNRDNDGQQKFIAAELAREKKAEEKANKKSFFTENTVGRSLAEDGRTIINSLEKSKAVEKPGKAIADYYDGKYDKVHVGGGASGKW